MKRLGQEEMLGSLAEELGRRRVREVKESSGRLPPKAKYWFPREGIVAASALRFLGCVYGWGERERERERETERQRERERECKYRCTKQRERVCRCVGVGILINHRYNSFRTEIGQGC